MVLMMRERVGEMAPFTVMVIMEACTIALTILAKTAMTGGMSPFVFVVYTNAVGSLLTDQSIFTFRLVRIFLLGLTGIAISQNIAFVGLSYSSPIVVCATGLLIPSLSLLLSIILRTTKPDLSSTGSQAKVIGTFDSIVNHVPKLSVFYSAPDRWILGGVLLMAASLSVSLWNVIQLGTVVLYPQVTKVASFYIA